MKYCCYIFLFAVVTLCFSCKKHQVAPEIQVAPKPPITYSISFTIGGKLFTVIEGDTHVSSSGNREANLKFDSIGHSNNVYYYSGSKDSVMFNHDITVINHAQSTGDDITLITVSVMRKYGKNQLIPSAGIVQPKNMLDLYAIGNYNYAFDFDRENALNGVALRINRLTGDKGVILTSYSDKLLHYPTAVTKATQAGCNFQIVSLNKTTQGQYYIIAKFNAMLFNSNDNPIKVSNGYLRLLLQ